MERQTKNNFLKLKKLARDGKLELARLNKENFKLKRKVDDYEAEVTDESFNSLPFSQELLPSSQELLSSSQELLLSSQEDIPAKKQKTSDSDIEKTFVLLKKNRNRSFGKNIEKQ